MGKHGSGEGSTPARVQLAASRRGVAPAPLSVSGAGALDDQSLVLWGAETGRIKAELSAGYLALMGGPQREAVRSEVLASAAGRYQNVGRMVELEPAAPENFTEQSASPSVRALARAMGVQLKNCKCSGPGATITEDDVAAEAKRAAAATAVAAAEAAAIAARPPSDGVVYASLFGGPVAAAVSPGDPDGWMYARNPRLDYYLRENPTVLQMAQRSGQPMPQMFATGALPLDTTSGIDPELLLRVPYQVRHVVAAADRPTAVAMLEKYAGPDGLLEVETGGAPVSPELAAYESRFDAWMSGFAS